MIAIKYLRNEVIDYREFKNTYEFAKWLVDQCKLEDIVIKDIKNIEESQQGLFFFRENYKAYYEREIIENMYLSVDVLYRQLMKVDIYLASDR